MAAALLSGAAYAQAIIEHAAAVAGATVGTAGGKALSNMIDKTLSKAADVGADAATAKKPNNNAAPNARATSSPQAEVPPAATPSTPAATRRARVARPPAPERTDQSLQQGFSVPVFAAAPPPSIEDFEKVKEGGARQDVFAALGTPSSHITIPDEGHLVEILTYSDGRNRIGSVRLDNGQVVSVSTAR